MKKFNVEAECVDLILQENVLAVLSKEPLTVVGSAFHNGGGLKTTCSILNVEVPKSCGDTNLHMDPERVISDSAKKINLKSEFVGMVTAACVRNFALSSFREGDLGVSVIATAADDEGNTCNYAESAGEKIETKVVTGTINIIVLIDGNPLDSCLVSSIITATEAKTAAMMELDIRSRYSGYAATGTITDAIVVAKTGRGAPIVYGGPASKLGQYVGRCTRKAVKEAIMKGQECNPRRPLLDRLAARHLSIETLAVELSKVKSLKVDKQQLALVLSKKVQSDRVFACALLATVKLNEDFEQGLLPPEVGNLSALGKSYGEMMFGRKSTKGDLDGSEKVNLPPFLKFVLIELARNALSCGEN